MGLYPFLAPLSRGFEDNVGFPEPPGVTHDFATRTSSEKIAKEAAKHFSAILDLVAHIK
jgi:hypothetical protein